MKSLNSCLQSVLRLAARDEGTAFIVLKELWPQIVGNELAERTHPIDLNRHRLLLRVEDETWEKEVQNLRPLLLRSINGYWGLCLVKEIATAATQRRWGDDRLSP